MHRPPKMGGQKKQAPDKLRNLIFVGAEGVEPPTLCL